jgi:hypothetical protein
MEKNEKVKKVFCFTPVTPSGQGIPEIMGL